MLFKINFKDGKISSHLRLVTKTGKAFFWSWWLEWWTRGSHSMIVATSISISRTKTIEKKKIYSSSQSHSRTWRQFWNLFLLALSTQFQRHMHEYVMEFVIEPFDICWQREACMSIFQIIGLLSHAYFHGTIILWLTRRQPFSL